MLGDWKLPTPIGVEIRGRARLWLAAVAVGVGQAAFDATIAYTRERIVFGKPVAHHQGNAFELAVAATNLQGARLLVRDAAAGFDRGDPHAGFWATQAWLGAVDAAIAVTDLGVQLLGGHGFLVDHLAEKRFREARTLALLAGGATRPRRTLAELVSTCRIALRAAAASRIEVDPRSRAMLLRCAARAQLRGRGLESDAAARRRRSTGSIDLRAPGRLRVARW